MKTFLQKTTRKKGHAPGTPIYTGDSPREPIRITLTLYTPKRLNRTELPAGSLPAASGNGVRWISVMGLHDPEIIVSIARQYRLHELTPDHIMDTSRRPGIVDRNGYWLASFRALSRENGIIVATQLSIVMLKGTVITFQEGQGDIFPDIRARLDENRAGMRERGADYLAFCIMHDIFDGYFSLLEEVGASIENMEETLISNEKGPDAADIHRVSKEILLIRNSVWPLRRMIDSFADGDHSNISSGVLPYFRALHERTMHILELLDALRDMIPGLHEIYASNVNLRMTAIMKILTIITSIFIPLSFIAGLYGMNFRSMPGTEWEFGYHATMIVMILIAAIMLAIFKIKKWL